MALEKQMELFDDGGLLQEGGSVDEESGNEVPIGSLKKEVRDDIPAQLSEGEFVMPADVVRYHGLDKMMALRDEAKAGLQRMDDMGQMGNADEAIIPDGVPFDVNDLEVEDEPMEMQVGGFVPSAQNQFGISGFQPSQFGVPQPPMMPAPLPAPAPTGLPQYAAPTQAFTPTAAPTTIPSFQQFIQPPAGMAPEIRVYINPQTGEERQITFINNQPTVPIPDGFILKSEYTAPTTPTPTTPTVTQPAQQQQEEDPSDGREFGGGPAGLTMKDSKIAVLTQLDNALPPEQRTGFGQKVADIKDKYKAPEGLAAFSMIGGIGRAFKESSELSKAVKDFDYDAAAANAGLTREEFDSVVNELTSEVYSGYRDPRTGEVSGQKDLRSIGERIGGMFKDEEYRDEYEELDPTDVAVKTTQVTAEPATTVTEAAKTEYKGIGKDPLSGKDIEPYDFETATRILEVGSPEQMLAELSRGNPALPAARALADLRAQASGAYTNFTDEEVDNARIVLNRFEETGRIPKEDKPVTPTRRTTFAPIDTEGVVEEETRIQQEAVRRQQQNKQEVDRQTRNYRNKGYSASDARSAAKNKVAADNTAKKQARDRGESEEHISKTTAVTDSKGNPVKQRDAVTGKIKKNEDGSDKVVTSEPEKDEPTESKIVCTEMYRQTQLDDWKEAIKIWGVHQKKYLTPYHEKGYHWLFKPWVRGMRKSVILTSVGAYLAKARTQHLKHILTHGKAKDDIVGNIWCKIVHPLTYIAGRTKEWLKL